MNLGRLDCTVAIIKNVRSNRMGRKDIIKIDASFPVNLDTLGYIDPGITVNIIENGKNVAKRKLELPERLVNIITCKNPRCITTVEQEIDQVFKLSDRETCTYKCAYCEAERRRG